MTASFDLDAEFRDDKGKGASRRLRRAGKVPAILYGGGQEPRSICLDHAGLSRQLEREAFYSHILTIRVGDLEQQAILKDLQRHPYKRQILHVDLQRIVAGEKIRMNVPLHFLGEDEAPGKKEGGVLSKLMTDVEVSCLPKDLPEFLDIDVSMMEMDDVRHLSDIILAEGVELIDLTAGHDEPVVALNPPRKEEIEEVEVAPEEGVLPPTEEGEVPPEEPGETPPKE